MVCCALWLGFWQIRGKRRKSEFFSLLLVLQPGLRAREDFTAVPGHARSPYAPAALTPECIIHPLLCHLVSVAVSFAWASLTQVSRCHRPAFISLLHVNRYGRIPSEWKSHTSIHACMITGTRTTHAHMQPLSLSFADFVFVQRADGPPSTLLNNKYTHCLSPWHFSLCPPRHPLSSTRRVRPLLLK